MVTINKPTVQEFRAANILWENYEGALEKMGKERKRLSAVLDTTTTIADRNNLYALMDKLGIAERTLSQKQADLEAWLIENEAPGWVST